MILRTLDRWLTMVAFIALVFVSFEARSQEAAEVLEDDIPEAMRESVEHAVALVKPALVRIMLVSTRYNEGRELKYEASGSGVIISKEGYVITNHHVAGNATRLVCTLTTKKDVEAELVGTDPMTDISILKLVPDEPREFPFASFGDSSAMQVGDSVLAMGSPMALSQSATLGIVSNTELVVPRMLGQSSFTLEGEDVGALVRWIGHDAAIYSGNSGGPLVNMKGEIIGINEVRMSLGGAIPGNLAKEVAAELIQNGEVKRSWLGITVQPLLRHGEIKEGVLVGGVIGGSPAEKAGLKTGDIIQRLGDAAVEVRFDEQLPLFNQIAADLIIGQPAEVGVLREGQEITLTVTPERRQKVLPHEEEFKQWGVTARDLSFVLAKQMKRDSTNGIVVTSVRPGGPAGDSKPQIQRDDVITKVKGEAVNTMQDFREITDKITEGKTAPTPVLTTFDRKTAQFVTVVEVGIKDLPKPGLEVKKAWLGVETQVITRDIAEEIGQPDLTGFRVVEVYPETPASKVDLEPGDLILEVDGMILEASAPEDYEELGALIRQYKMGTSAELTISRDRQRRKVSMELEGEPQPAREMAKYRDTDFEFTVRDICFFDKVREKWPQEQQGVIVDEVESGGWAAVGTLYAGDLILEVDRQTIQNAETFETFMETLAESKPETVVFKVFRGINTLYLEMQPKWQGADADHAKGKE